MSAEPAIRVRGVHKRFGSRDALAGVSLEVERGSCTAVLGRNGSGKTTLVRLLATLAAPNEGEISVAGLPLPAEEAEVRRRIGVVLDHAFLPRDLRVEEGLRFWAEIYAVADPAARVREVAGRFGLGPRLSDPFRTLSRGYAQRCALARAWLHDPEVLLLDEPTNALDADGCRVLAKAIEDAAAAARTVVLVTHDLPFAASVSTRAVLLRKGKVAATGDPREVCAQADGEGRAA